jgi:hypothetical protein
MTALLYREQRVHRYSLFRVKDALAKRNLVLMDRSLVCLPPRRFPEWGRFLDSRIFRWALDHIPGFAVVASHAFILAFQRITP